MVCAKRSSSCWMTPATRPIDSSSSGYGSRISSATCCAISKRKGCFEAEHAPVAHRAANDLAQHVAAAFVRGHHAVADQERGGAAVVGEDAQRRIGFRRRAIRLSAQLAGEIDQRPE